MDLITEETNVELAMGDIFVRVVILGFRVDQV
jgi:hypothetical protein